MNNCSKCNKEWQERYTLAARRFDKALNTANTVTVIAVSIALICIIITAICTVKTQQFISNFEYVEETIVTQDGEGQNIAVVGDNNEVGKEF